MAGQDSGKVRFLWGVFTGAVLASVVLFSWAGCQRAAREREVQAMDTAWNLRERKLNVRVDQLVRAKEKAEESFLALSRLAAERQSKAKALEDLAKAAEAKRARVANEGQNVVRLLALSREVEVNLRLACQEKDAVIANLNLSIVALRQAQEAQEKENKELRDARALDAIDLNRLRELATGRDVAPHIKPRVTVLSVAVKVAAVASVAYVFVAKVLPWAMKFLGVK